MTSDPKTCHLPRPAPDKPLTAAETAELFGVTTRTLRNWEKRGDICAIRLGGMKFFTRAAIDRALSGMASQTSTNSE